METVILVSIALIVLLVILVAWFGPRPPQWRTHSESVGRDEEENEEEGKGREEGGAGE